MRQARRDARLVDEHRDELLVPPVLGADHLQRDELAGARGRSARARRWPCRPPRWARAPRSRRDARTAACCSAVSVTCRSPLLGANGKDTPPPRRACKRARDEHHDTGRAAARASRSGARRAQVVGRREEDLRPAHARRHAHHVEQLDRLVDERRVVLLARERRHAAAHVAGERLHLLERHGVALAVAGELRQRLEVERRVAGDDGEQHAGPVAASDERLEDLLGGRPTRAATSSAGRCSSPGS